MLQLQSESSRVRAELRPAEESGAHAAGDPNRSIGRDALDAVIDFDESNVSVFEPIILEQRAPES